MGLFAVIASVRRGRIDPSERLNEAGQAAAFWRMREDESQALRVDFELRRNRVVWNKARIEETLRLKREEARRVALMLARPVRRRMA